MHYHLSERDLKEYAENIETSKEDILDDIESFKGKRVNELKRFNDFWLYYKIIKYKKCKKELDPTIE